MADLKDRRTARTALMWVAPARTNPLWTLLGADITKLGPVPFPVLGWAAVVGTLVSAIHAVAEGFSAHALTALAVLGGLLVVLAARAYLVSQPHFTIWWRLYVLSASAAHVDLYLGSKKKPGKAPFTLTWVKGTPAEVVFTFPDNSNVVRYPSNRRELLEETKTLLEEKVRPAQVALSSWDPASRQLRVWLAETDAVETQQELTHDKLVAAANEATGTNLDYKDSTVDVVVTTWDPMFPASPAEVVLTAATAEALTRVKRQNFQDTFAGALDPSGELVLDWRWESDHRTQVQLYSRASEDGGRVLAQQALYTTLEGLLGYTNDDHLTDVRITSWRGGPVSFVATFVPSMTEHAIRSFWPAALRSTMARMWPDRVFTDPVFSGSQVVCNAVPATSPDGQVLAELVRVEEIALACASRQPLTGESFTGSLNGSFTAVLRVQSHHLHHSWWRKDFEKSVTAALPGTTVQWSAPTSQVAIVRTP